MRRRTWTPFEAGSSPLIYSKSVSCLCTDEASGWLRRFIQGELSPEEAAERKDIPLEFVLSALTVRGSVS